jgi:hypothetical protein
MMTRSRRRTLPGGLKIEIESYAETINPVVQLIEKDLGGEPQKGKNG